MKRIGKGLLALIIVGVLAIGVWGWAPDTDPAAMRAKYGNAASQFIDFGGGVTMHVRDEGVKTGPVLVLIHGSNSSLQTWEPWVARLKGKYRLISLDLPGHGLTGANPAGDYHDAAFVSELDTLLAKLGIAKAVIAGNSMGGGVAWHYALAHPERVSGLVLVDAAGAPGWQARKVPIGFRIARMPVIKNISLYITPRSLVEKSLVTSVGDPAIINDKMVDRYWELLRYPGNRAATLKRFDQPRSVEAGSKEEVAKITAPTLILWGAEDNLIPVASSRWFASAIPGAKLVIYPGVGHLPMEEVADQSAADVDGFMADLGT
jgi:pimeloyl-ACP methyl ester carboxylesterase